MLMILCGFFCELPQNPRTIDNAGVTRQTLTAIPVTVPVNSVYPCTVLVRYPEFIDSFTVVKSVNSGNPERIAGAAVDDDTTLLFSLHLPEPASYVITLLIYKGDRVDSLSTAVDVFSTTPLVAAAQTRVVTMVDSQTAVRFTAADPDSNLLAYILISGNAVPDTQQFHAGERAAATIRQELPVSLLTALHDTLVRFSAVVMDEDSQTSAAALCTLIVRDTVHPAITPLPPFNDSVRTVVKLPDTLRAVAVDNWAIDSVKFGGGRVSFSNGDTVRVVINKLDSGKTVDTLDAWDPAGNRTAIGIAMHYSGPKVYPPKIIPFYQTVNEGGRFDTVYLDQKVTITDSAATYGKDALRWTVAVTAKDSGMTVEFDSSKRALSIAGPAGELFRDRSVVLNLTVTDPAGQSDVLHGAMFIMVEKNDPPRITVKGQGRFFDSPFDTLRLDTCGHDPEKNAQLSWTITRGAYFYPLFLKITRCTGIIIDKTTPTPVCFDYPTGKVLILPDTVAIKAVPSTQEAIFDTLLFSLKGVTAGDTAETMKRIPFSWGRMKVWIPIEIPEFYLRQ
ncbi:MAG: hypothetical protein JW913_01005 [Chitinispirillaceae bacterium]|nr:hypothetical protein [Chitinispirillaceae bacterium]